MEQKINKDTTIEEIVRKYPALIRPLKEHGITCVACGEPVWGTLEENIQNKNLSNLDEIVEEMNDILQKNGTAQ